jgi:hypothetical protein
MRLREPAASRRQSRKRCTAGRSVRFFSVTMSAGHSGSGRSTGSSFRELPAGPNHRTELGSTAMKRPRMLRIFRRCTENVVIATGGIDIPTARNASMMAAPPGVSGDGEIKGTPASSVRLILRRRAHGLSLEAARQIRSRNRTSAKRCSDRSASNGFGKRVMTISAFLSCSAAKPMT